ncbi:unnamed protein product [Closterium sp. NIES-64]|nr:unnamed protein product [Closterium sp. NIES-64]
MKKYGPQIVREEVEEGAGIGENGGVEEVKGEEAAAQEKKDGMDKEMKEEEAEADASEEGSPGTASHHIHGTGGGVAATAASATAAAALPLLDPLQLLLWVAVSPAVAEELLFRGLLLMALQERLGRIDAAMLSAALFARFHLSLARLFPNMALGIAAGLLAVYSNSDLPAVALHTTLDASALIYALMAATIASV